MSLLLELFISFFLVAFVSFGGATAVIPELYRIAVTEHAWMSAQTFTELFAIAQAAPGPNVHIVTLIGQHVAGWSGAVLATLGMCLPMSVLVGILFKHWDRLQHWRGRAAIEGKRPRACRGGGAPARRGRRTPGRRDRRADDACRPEAA